MLTLMAVSALAQDRAAGPRSDIVLQALSLLGTPYRYGGASPESGFDCSGLVRHVFAAVLNRELPRRSEDISGVGEPVSRAELQPGDLVFFNTLRRAFSHVAIYVGEGRFVHAPARNGRVRIEGLDDRYWATRFNGARRLLEAAPSGGAAARAPIAQTTGAFPSRSGDFAVDRPPEP
ncbi:MAG: C40 family peptidase [Burkholderiaceae bacterium]